MYFAFVSSILQERIKYSMFLFIYFLIIMRSIDNAVEKKEFIIKKIKKNLSHYLSVSKFLLVSLFLNVLRFVLLMNSSRNSGIKSKFSNLKRFM